jgi:hypothetical protein
MRVRLSTLVIAGFIACASPASAQYIVVDANGTLVGNVVGVMQRNDPSQTVVVVTQDANGIWISMELALDGLVGTPTQHDVFFTDPACATTPYLPMSRTRVPLFRPLLPGTAQEFNLRGYYPGNPVVNQTFQYFAPNGSLPACQPANAGPMLAGPQNVFDLTQFVPPFRVPSLLKVGSAGQVVP